MAAHENRKGIKYMKFYLLQVKMAPILSTEEIKSFLESKRHLLSTPNIVSLGFIDDEETGGKIFRVGVIKKQPKESIKHPDIFIPKYFEHARDNSNELMAIPVKVVEEGELQFFS